MKADPIGGYFSLELRSFGNPPFPNSILLNSGRACFEYVLEANATKHVYLPTYTCDVMLNPLEKLNIPYTFYGINEKLELVDLPELNDGDYLLYTNYFGAKDAYCNRLSERYGEKLILDCSQAFYYSSSQNSHTFYSPRKFFGMPDGGVLYTKTHLGRALEVDVSYERTSHLLKRLELGPKAGYADFKTNDAALREQPLSAMSALSTKLLDSIDHVSAKDQRNKNFLFLHKSLENSNNYQYIEIPDGPMSYVYRTTDTELRDKLISQDIFVPTYWPNVLEWSKEGELEHKLVSELLALPIDQRYDEKDMERIVRVISES